MYYDLIVIGGGAAGMFAAIQAKMTNPDATVLLLEKTAVLLSKVRISGGGRCNVTHSCFDPKELVKNYPRGSKELLGAFYRFGPSETISFFQENGVTLKTEEDGRMFPTTNQSETIIQCLVQKAEALGVEIRMRAGVEHLKHQDDLFTLTLKNGETLNTRNLLLASGSSPEGHELARELGHTITKPVPSLFTFNVPNSPLKELSGISLESVQLHFPGSNLKQKGILLITHFGFSGPAALKLSAWAARFLHEKGYKAPLEIDWLPSFSEEKIATTIFTLKDDLPEKTLVSENPFHFPKNLWRALILDAGITLQKRLSELSNKEIRTLAAKLHRDTYQIDGKTTHKEEFVTCGGIDLKEVDFKTMESKLCPGLYFAGEILDIDGVTGGFNFQNAWTTGYLAGSALTTNLASV